MEIYPYGFPQLVKSWWKDIFVRDIDGTNAYFKSIRLVYSGVTKRKPSTYIEILPDASSSPGGSAQLLNCSGEIYVQSSDTTFYSNVTYNNYVLGRESFESLIGSAAGGATITGFIGTYIPNPTSSQPMPGREYWIGFHETDITNLLQLVYNSGSSTYTLQNNGQVDIYMRSNDLVKIIYLNEYGFWGVAKVGPPWAEYELV